MLIVSAVPVAVAAFLLRPRAAFELAGAVRRPLRDGVAAPRTDAQVNLLSLLALAGVALVSYLTARRVEWLEEAEDMYRRELDRLADERDVLKGQVRALADEVEKREASEAAEPPGAADPQKRAAWVRAAPSFAASSRARLRACSTRGGRSSCTVSQRMSRSTPKYSCTTMLRTARIVVQGTSGMGFPDRPGDPPDRLAHHHEVADDGIDRLAVGGEVSASCPSL